MKVSLVIPAYNESKIVLDTLRTVSEKLSALTEDYEVLLVDDGSTDNMAELVRGCGDPHIRLEGYTPNRGKGCAVRTGMLAAKGEYILCTDADLAYGVEVFSTFLERLKATGADVAVGSRRLDPEGYKDYPPLRLVASKCFGALVRMASGLKYDTQCGIKAYRAGAAREIFSRCGTDGFAFDFEALMLADRLGLRVEQIGVSVVNHRESKISLLRDSLRMFRDIFRIRQRVRRTMESGGKKTHE